MTQALMTTEDRILPMSNAAIEKVAKVEKLMMALPQGELFTQHLIHGGMYARTIMIPAGMMITGALIKIATILIVQGECVVYANDDAIAMKGFHVLAASAHRKQAFMAKSDTHLTMIFPTQATSIDDAEVEFTDEHAFLASRRDSNTNSVLITGE